PCAEREEELGDRRTDRDDPLGTLGDRDAAVLEVADRRREGRRRRRRGARRGGRGRGGRGVRAAGGEEEEEDHEESGERHGHLAHPFLAKACKPRAGGQATRVRTIRPSRWRDPAGIAPASLTSRVFSCWPRTC